MCYSDNGIPNHGEVPRVRSSFKEGRGDNIQVSDQHCDRDEGVRRVHSDPPHVNCAIRCLAMSWCHCHVIAKHVVAALMTEKLSRKPLQVVACREVKTLLCAQLC